MFDIDEDTAKHSYQDILMYFFNFDDFIPSIWNDPQVSDQEIEQLLFNIRDRQSPSTKVKSVRLCATSQLKSWVKYVGTCVVFWFLDQTDITAYPAFRGVAIY